MSNIDTEHLAALLRSIEQKLIDIVPTAVATMTFKSAPCMLYLWCHDLSVEEVTPVLGVATSGFRDACLSGKYDEQLGGTPEDAFFRPLQCVTAALPGFPIATVPCEIVDKEMVAAYELVSQTQEDVDEFEMLEPIREMMKRVGKALEGIDWQSKINATNDFGVLISDFIGADLGDECDDGFAN